jgi:hypothetical protein
VRVAAVSVREIIAVGSTQRANLGITVLPACLAVFVPVATAEFAHEHQTPFPALIPYGSTLNIELIFVAHFVPTGIDQRL